MECSECKINKAEIHMFFCQVCMDKMQAALEEFVKKKGA